MQSGSTRSCSSAEADRYEAAWKTRRKVKGKGNTKTKQPVFAVDSWCFRKEADTATDYAEVFKEYRPVIGSVTRHRFRSRAESACNIGAIYGAAYAHSA
jgi:hypothetical protein